jgi:acyl carrier protein
MQQDEVLAGIREVLSAVTGIDRPVITLEAQFGDDLGIDSLTMVDVVVAAEDRFGLIIPDDDWARFVTVGDAVAHLEQAALLPH